jgi:hypothetical protein
MTENEKSKVLLRFARLVLLIPSFLLTANNLDETFGQWHIRTFGRRL